MSVENLEAMAKKQMDVSQLKALRSSLEIKYPQEGEFVQNYTSALVEKLSSLQIITPKELESLGDNRAKTVANYLFKNPVLANRVSIGAHEESIFSAKEGILTRLELTVQ
jgi:hypothetical protein